MGTDANTSFNGHLIIAFEVLIEISGWIINVTSKIIRLSAWLWYKNCDIRWYKKNLNSILRFCNYFQIFTYYAVSVDTSLLNTCSVDTVSPGSTANFILTTGTSHIAVRFWSFTIARNFITTKALGTFRFIFYSNKLNSSRKNQIIKLLFLRILNTSI